MSETNPNTLVVEFESGSQLITEGFGPNSLAGIVKDVLEGNYTPEHSAVRSITITKDDPFV